MIIPYLKGFPTLKQAPTTWMIILLNLFLFFSFQEQQNRIQVAFKNFYKNEKLEETQGLLYAQYIEMKSEYYSSIFNEMSSLALSGNPEFIKRMSYFSLRDSQFLSKGIYTDYYGDQVILNYWRLKFISFLKFFLKDPSRKWGLQKDHEEFFRWISYQFIHSGYLHIIFNIFFLLIFGKVLESYMGSFLFLLFYLSSGAFSALSFKFLSGLSSAPLIGASGSIAGLIGFYCFLNWKRPIRFMYWLLPIKGYTGFVNLSAWVMLVCWFVINLSGYLSTVEGLNNIAHTAHLGGLSFGMLLASLVQLFTWSKSASKSIFSYTFRI